MKRLLPGFKMTFPDLCMFVSSLVMFMKQDAAYFATRGVSMDNILALEALGNACEVFPSDTYFAGGVMEAVEAKNDERKKALKIARDITGYFIQAYGAGSGQYKRLSVDEFHKSNDNIFIYLMRDIARIAGELLPELSAIGLTQAKIDSLVSAADSMESYVEAAADAKALRLEKTAERIAKGNELYALAKKYCTIGKLLATEHPEVNYKSYVIYRNKKKKKAGEPTAQ